MYDGCISYGIKLFHILDHIFQNCSENMQCATKMLHIIVHVSERVFCVCYGLLLLSVWLLVLCLNTPVHISISLPGSVSVWHVPVWTDQDRSDADKGQIWIEWGHTVNVTSCCAITLHMMAWASLWPKFKVINRAWSDTITLPAFILSCFPVYFFLIICLIHSHNVPWVSHLLILWIACMNNGETKPAKKAWCSELYFQLWTSNASCSLVCKTHKSEDMVGE